MHVRLLTGKNAKQIADLPYHAATALLSSGQAAKVTAEEVVAWKAETEAARRKAAGQPERDAPGALIHEVKDGPGIGNRIVRSATPGFYDVLFDGAALNERPLALSEAQILATTAPEDLPVKPPPAATPDPAATDWPAWRQKDAAGIALPETWRELDWNGLRSLAAGLTTEKITGKDIAIAAIERELATREATPDPAATE